jgi:hypothetical protein
MHKHTHTYISRAQNIHAHTTGSNNTYTHTLCEQKTTSSDVTTLFYQHSCTYTHTHMSQAQIAVTRVGELNKKAAELLQELRIRIGKYNLCGLVSIHGCTCKPGSRLPISAPKSKWYVITSWLSVSPWWMCLPTKQQASCKCPGSGLLSDT